MIAEFNRNPVIINPEIKIKSSKELTMVTEGSAGSNQSQDKIPKLLEGKKHGKASN